MDNLLISSADRVFREQVTKDFLVDIDEGRWPQRLWELLDETGLTQLARSEDRGGIGAHRNDVGHVIRLAGHHLLPLPLAETVLGELLLSSAGLPPVDGPLSIGPVLADDRLTLKREGVGWLLSGQVRRIPWGRHVVALVLVVTDEDARNRTVVVRGIRPDSEAANLAGEARDTFLFNELPIHELDVGNADAGMDVEALHLEGALLRSLQMVGAMDQILAQTVKYANDRSQFGRPIAKFQAIQHQIAVMASHIAAATAAATAAADCDAPFEKAAAKVRAGEAAGLAAGVAHQVQAAIGFTYENHLQFATRRLWSWRDEFGGETAWSRWIGKAVFARYQTPLWHFLTESVATPTE